MVEVFEIPNFEFEGGGKIDSLKIAYSTYGQINKDKSNVIWVFHALTANSKVVEWWPGLFGDGCLYNPQDHYIICANIIGSPYGSTCPEDLDFPLFSVRDTVTAEIALAVHLGIDHIHTLIGGSCGGSQVIEFAYSYPGKVDHLITIAAGPKESPWSIAVHETQRMALQADPAFGTKEANTLGLKAARAIGMLTYRTAESIINKQQDNEEKLDDFKAASYMQYQGDKFADRFDAISYYYLTKSLDTHDVGRGRGGYTAALREITISSLVIAIDSDLLIPAITQKEMANLLPNATYSEIKSLYGHDGFLMEVENITVQISEFYQTQNNFNNECE